MTDAKDMTPVPMTMVQSMQSQVGREVLIELFSTSWDSPALKTMESVGLTVGFHPGQVRLRNEDRAAIAYVNSRFGGQYFLAIVCDGVGGSEFGDSAANLAIASLIDQMVSIGSVESLSQSILGALRRVDDSVRTQLKGKGTTTLSMVVASKSGDFVAANIGDSRLFSWNSEVSRFTQVSIDDTLENELRHLPMGDTSVLDERGLRGSLSQAIGESGRTSNALRINIFKKNDFPGGGIILASDGTWKVNEEGFKSIAIHSSTTTEVVRRVLAFSAWIGGVDNASIVAINNIDSVFINDGLMSSMETKNFGVTMWFGDSKLIIRGEDSYRPLKSQQPNPNNLDYPSELQKNKEKRKTQARQRSKVKPKPSRSAQLDLVANIPSDSDKKPKLEISTDSE